MDLVDKYLGESTLTNKQIKAIDDMKKKGFHIVVWEFNFVAMMDKKGTPAEVYPDGKVKYPKMRIDR